MLSEDQIKGKFAIVNPNYRNSDRSLNTTIESTSSDFLSTEALKHHVLVLVWVQVLNNILIFMLILIYPHIMKN